MLLTEESCCIVPTEVDPIGWLFRTFGEKNQNRPQRVNAWVAVGHTRYLSQVRWRCRSPGLAIPGLQSLIFTKGAEEPVFRIHLNQESLNDDVRLFLDDPATDVAQASQTNRGHECIETRMASISCDVAWLQERHQWSGLTAVGKITASRQEGGHSSVKRRYYLLSQPLPPARFNQIVRAHWGIENQLHWVLDVVFNEDQSRNRKDNCPDNLTRQEPSKGSMRGKLKRAGWDNNYLATLLSQFTKIEMR